MGPNSHGAKQSLLTFVYCLNYSLVKLSNLDESMELCSHWVVFECYFFYIPSSLHNLDGSIKQGISGVRSLWHFFYILSSITNPDESMELERH